MFLICIQKCYIFLWVDFVESIAHFWKFSSGIFGMSFVSSANRNNLASFAICVASFPFSLASASSTIFLKREDSGFHQIASVFLHLGWCAVAFISFLDFFGDFHIMHPNSVHLPVPLYFAIPVSQPSWKRKQSKQRKTRTTTKNKSLINQSRTKTTLVALEASVCM